MRRNDNNSAIATEETEFASVLGIIATHRSWALMSVNVESLLTYWEIGAFLSPRIHSGSWSTAVVGKLADYIKRNQPELRGYGKSNLYNVARVYDAFSGERFGTLLRKYETRIPKIGNFFQPADGKSLLGGETGVILPALAEQKRIVGLVEAEEAAIAAGEGNVFRLGGAQSRDPRPARRRAVKGTGSNDR